MFLNSNLHNESEKILFKPFLKWAGGKGQLLNRIRAAYPDGLGKSITKYAEPFIGGGAVLFDVLSNYNLERVYLSDTNISLINVYKVIRDDVDALVMYLRHIQEEYIFMNSDNRKKYYYEKRKRFNELIGCEKAKINIEKAALFIFLNKTCFNGLFRVNSKGLFNVPAGENKNIFIYDEMNLFNISVALKKVIIVCGDYKKSDEFIDKNTFVYFDPPYRPLTETAKFISYTETMFDDDAQIELAGYVRTLSERGSKIIISNSDPKNSDIEDDFFDRLYMGFNINRLQALRMINCNGKSRGKISELLITNY